MNTLDNYLGHHAAALSFREQRARIISENIANADTPGYKAKDLKFEHILSQSSTNSNMDRTHNRHMRPNNLSDNAGIITKRVEQPSLDGNTVDTMKEQAAFAENSVRYQTSLIYMQSKIKGLLTAIKGE